MPTMRVGMKVTRKQNGGLAMQHLIDAAVPHLKGKLTGFEARLRRPLWSVIALSRRVARLTRDGTLRTAISAAQSNWSMPNA
jgi:hypothetical protein